MAQADRADSGGSGSWTDTLRGAALAVEIGAVVASSPAAAVHDHIDLADPVMDAGITALAAGHDALGAAAEARQDADEVADAIDVAHDVTTSAPLGDAEQATDVADHADADAGTDGDGDAVGGMS